MSDPALAEQVKGVGRMYRFPPTGELFPSVTSVIGILDKPALVGWAAKMTAQAAWDNRKALVQMDDREAAVDMLKNSRYRSGDRAKDLGTNVHEIAEALSKDQALPAIDPEAAPFMDHFLQFIDDYDIRFEVVEGTVFSERHRYAGTFDFLGRSGDVDVLLLGDHKSGSGVYSEVALQLAALRYADLLWDSETGELLPMPEVAGCIAVHLRPDRYTVFSIGADEAAFEAFVGLRGAWSWAKAGGSNGAVGPAMSAQRLAALLGGPKLVVSS